MIFWQELVKHAVISTIKHPERKTVRSYFHVISTYKEMTNFSLSWSERKKWNFLKNMLWIVWSSPVSNYGSYWYYMGPQGWDQYASSSVCATGCCTAMLWTRINYLRRTQNLWWWNLTTFLLVLAMDKAVLELC